MRTWITIAFLSVASCAGELEGPAPDGEATGEHDGMACAPEGAACFEAAPWACCSQACVAGICVPVSR